MRKTFSSLILAASILLASSMYENTPRASAQGIVQEAIMAALKGAGATFTSELYDPSGGNQVCWIRYTVKDARGLKAMALLEDITGLTTMQLYQNGVQAVRASGTGEYFYSFFMPPSFCDPPSGTSPATNPTSALDDDSKRFLDNLELAVAAFLGALGIIWGIPRFAQAKVRF